MNFDNFMLLDQSVKEIVRGWFLHADNGRDEMQRFINLWMSFNGWATCVTEEETDAAMIRAVIEDARMRNAFDTLYERDGYFRPAVDAFVDWWPIYDARSFRKKARQHRVHDIYSREDVRRYAEQWSIAKSPRNWTAGNRPSWSETIWAIYKVRCNLFHGQKGMQNPSDVQLVRVTYDVLWHLIDKSECYNWQ